MFRFILCGLTAIAIGVLAGKTYLVGLSVRASSPQAPALAARLPAPPAQPLPSADEAASEAPSSTTTAAPAATPKPDLHNPAADAPAPRPSASSTRVAKAPAAVAADKPKPRAARMTRPVDRTPATSSRNKKHVVLATAGRRDKHDDDEC
jgi:hypothetical protein